jgi:ATP-dependent Clp protease adaptor protein ClpS
VNWPLIAPKNSDSNPPAARRPGKLPPVSQKPQESSDVAVAEARPKVSEPSRYACVLYNDDYTTMEFVVEVLFRFFGKSEEQAVHIMMRVHKEGRGVAGIYSHEVAETKAHLVTEYARSKKFPLKVEIEEVSA